MSNPYFPFAVRLIGFSSEEARRFETSFAAPGGSGYGYFVLGEGNLQDPDLYICKASDPRALVQLSYLRPSDVRPALLVGVPPSGTSHPHVRSPIDWTELIAALDKLMEKRADVLSGLAASDIVQVPERRRRERLDPAMTDPGVYQKMRANIPEDGKVVVLDKSSALSDYLSELLERHKLRVEWVGDEASAEAACNRSPTAVMFINTSTPLIDPYRVCGAVKDKHVPQRLAAIFLISEPFVLDMDRAREVGMDGYLSKPLSSHHLISALKKFMPRLY